MSIYLIGKKKDIYHLLQIFFLNNYSNQISLHCVPCELCFLQFLLQLSSISRCFDQVILGNLYLFFTAYIKLF